MSRPDLSHPVREAVRGIALLTLLSLSMGASAALIAGVVLLLVESG